MTRTDPLTDGATGALRKLPYRLLWLPAGAAAALLVVALTLLVLVSWRGFRRVQPIRQHLDYMDQLQQTELRLEAVLLAEARGQPELDPSQLESLLQEVRRLGQGEGRLVRDAGPAERAPEPVAAQDAAVLLAATLEDVRRLVSTESSAHIALVNALEEDAGLELLASTGLAAGLPLLVLLLLGLLRLRILMPLDTLRSLMSKLGPPDYPLIPTSGVNPLLRPVFANYNAMADRLRELERQGQARRLSLEQEVRDAVAALLQQQRELARAERLAAVGEVAARLAHELRNPLAGIQMAMTSLRGDLKEPEQAERLDVAIGELKHTVRLLGRLLDQSRVTPAAPSPVRIPAVVEGVLALVRYQVPGRIRLVQQTPEDLQCWLPEGGLRRAILNLVLNAAQAMGDESGAITVAARANQGRLELTICDDGPGFPSELLEAGAQPFGTWRSGGTGLGLATVRRFARELEGEIVLSNRQPRGARATLRLPCKASRV